MKKIKTVRNRIVFGTVIIDKLHQFFGKSDPIACIVVSAWGDEMEDGLNAEVWIEHFRGHFTKTYSDLRDTSKWEVTDVRIDTSKPVLPQLQEVEEKYVSAPNKP